MHKTKAHTYSSWPCCAVDALAIHVTMRRLSMGPPGVTRMRPVVRPPAEDAAGLAVVEWRVGEQGDHDLLQRDADPHAIHHVGFAAVVQIHLQTCAEQTTSCLLGRYRCADYQRLHSQTAFAFKFTSPLRKVAQWKHNPRVFSNQLAWMLAVEKICSFATSVSSAATHSGMARKSAARMSGMSGTSAEVEHGSKPSVRNLTPTSAPSAFTCTDRTAMDRILRRGGWGAHPANVR